MFTIFLTTTDFHFFALSSSTNVPISLALYICIIDEVVDAPEHCFLWFEAHKWFWLTIN